jgi:ribosome-associated translation inhibitor RaiA
MSATEQTQQGPSGKLAQRLRLGGGFAQSERDYILRALDGLEHHLAGWTPEQLDVEVSVKNRDGPEQKVTLNAWLAGWPHMVATSNDRDLNHALVEVRKELVRQIEERRNQRKPDKAKSRKKPPP